MKTIIRFLTDCYQFMIVAGFVGSVLMYSFWIFINVVALIKYSQTDFGGLISLGAIVASMVIATVLEALFLLAMGAAAILIDIRNEIAWNNVKDQE